MLLDSRYSRDNMLRHENNAWQCSEHLLAPRCRKRLLLVVSDADNNKMLRNNSVLKVKKPLKGTFYKEKVLVGIVQCTLLTWPNDPYMSENVFCFHLVHAGQHWPARPAQPLLSWPRCRPVIIIILIRLALFSPLILISTWQECVFISSLENMYGV